MCINSNDAMPIAVIENESLLEGSLSPLSYLPDEILLHIFSMLNLSGISTIMLTNKKFNRIGRDNVVWKKFCCEKFPSLFNFYLKIKYSDQPINYHSFFSNVCKFFSPKYPIQWDAKAIQIKDIEQHYFFGESCLTVHKGQLSLLDSFSGNIIKTISSVDAVIKKFIFLKHVINVISSKDITFIYYKDFGKSTFLTTESSEFTHVLRYYNSNIFFAVLQNRYLYTIDHAERKNMAIYNFSEPFKDLFIHENLFTFIFNNSISFFRVLKDFSLSRERHIPSVMTITKCVQEKSMLAYGSGQIIYVMDVCQAADPKEVDCSSPLCCIAVTEKYLFGASEDHSITLCNVEGEKLHILTRHTAKVKSMEVVENRWLLSIDEEGVMCLWDILTGKHLKNISQRTT